MVAASPTPCPGQILSVGVCLPSGLVGFRAACIVTRRSSHTDTEPAILCDNPQCTVWTKIPGSDPLSFGTHFWFQCAAQCLSALGVGRCGPNVSVAVVSGGFDSHNVPKSPLWPPGEPLRRSRSAPNGRSMSSTTTCRRDRFAKPFLRSRSRLSVSRAQPRPAGSAFGGPVYG